MITPAQISSCVQEYLSDRIRGTDLVNYIDDAVSTDAVYEYSQELQKLIMIYQDLLALYVDDPIRRLEHPAYYGPEKLRVFASDLKQELDALIWERKKG